jgi:hypothetical protein
MGVAPPTTAESSCGSPSRGRTSAARSPGSAIVLRADVALRGSRVHILPHGGRPHRRALGGTRRSTRARGDRLTGLKIRNIASFERADAQPRIQPPRRRVSRPSDGAASVHGRPPRAAAPRETMASGIISFNASSSRATRGSSESPTQPVRSIRRSHGRGRRRRGRRSRRRRARSRRCDPTRAGGPASRDSGPGMNGGSCFTKLRIKRTYVQHPLFARQPSLGREWASCRFSGTTSDEAPDRL